MSKLPLNCNQTKQTMSRWNLSSSVCRSRWWLWENKEDRFQGRVSRREGRTGGELVLYLSTHLYFLLIQTHAFASVCLFVFIVGPSITMIIQNTVVAGSWKSVNSTVAVSTPLNYLKIIPVLESPEIVLKFTWDTTGNVSHACNLAVTVWHCLSDFHQA